MKKHPITLNGVAFSEILVAENYADMDTGLDKLDSLDERSGLIYVFEKPGKYAFNNENPNFPIDLVTLDEKGVVTDVRNLKPKENGEKPEQPLLYALEILGGMAAKIGLAKGMPSGLDLASLEIYRNSYNVRTRIRPANIPLPSGWLDEARRQIQERDAERDDLFDLNIALVGAKYNLEVLRASGWKDACKPMPIEPYLHSIGVWGWDVDASGGSDKWLEFDSRFGGSRILFRLFCSRPGHFRYMYAVGLDENGGFLEKPVVALPGNLKEKMLDLFKSALVEPPARDVDEELWIITSDYKKKQTNDDGDERYKRLMLWAYEFERQGKVSPYYQHRFLNGMLRFGCFCDYEDILAVTIHHSLKTNYQHGIVRLLNVILQRINIDSAPLWNVMGCAFDHLGMNEAALYCFISAWRKQYSKEFGQNIWILGEKLLPEYFKKREMSKAALTADAMLASIPADSEPKKLPEVLCALGMTYEYDENVQMTLECYSSALAIYCGDRTAEARRKDKDADEYDRTQTFHDYPLLFQSVFRTTMQNPDARRRQLERQMDCYPDVPDAKGLDGNVPVSYIEGYGMGDLWDSVAPGILHDEPEKVIKTIVENGKPYGESHALPEYACGGAVLEKSLGLAYERPEENNSPLFSLSILGLPANEKKLTVISGMPAFRPGNGWRLKSPLLSISLWNNAVEASAEFRLCEGHTLECYLQDYGMRDYTFKSGRNYEIEIAVFGYDMSRFEGHEFDIDRGPMLDEERKRLRKEGKDDNISSVKVTMPEDMCNINRSFSGWEHDVSIIARIEQRDDFVFMGRDCIKFTLAFDERGGYAKLPVFMAREKFDDGEIPKVGDSVECSGWLQGIVLGETGDEAEDKSDDEEKIDYDWTNSIFLSSIGKNTELDSMAINTVGRKHDVENIVRFPDALPEDPVFSCSVNGENVFVKVCTGYFDTEEECRKAVGNALMATPWHWHGSECRLAIVAGIRSESNKDGYNMVYRGMAGDDDWREDVYDFLGVRLPNLYKMKEDKAIKIDGREMPVSNVWHWKYDFMDDSTDCKSRMAVVNAVMDAWQRLDASVFESILAGDKFTYGSYWVNDTMRGSNTYCSYIAGKFSSIARTDSAPKISLVRLVEGLVPHGFAYALHMQQGKNSTLLTFDFDGDKVSGMYMPDPDIYTFEML